MKIGIYSIFFSLLSAFNFSYANGYFDTVKQIEQIYASSSTHNHLDFTELDIVKSEDKLKSLLEQILNNENCILDHISAYYHPVGFIKMVIYRGEKGQQMRFHFWGRENKKVVHQDFKEGWEPIHNHRWNFSSKVIKGKLNVREYKNPFQGKRFNDINQAEVGRLSLKEGNKYSLFEIFEIPGRQVQKGYNVINTRTFAIIGNMKKRKITNGETYYTDHKTLHQVRPEPYTSTLLLLDPPSKTIASEIFVDRDDQFLTEMELTELTPDEIQEEVEAFLNSL